MGSPAESEYSSEEFSSDDFESAEDPIEAASVDDSPELEPNESFAEFSSDDFESAEYPVETASDDDSPELEPNEPVAENKFAVNDSAEIELDFESEIEPLKFVPAEKKSVFDSGEFSKDELIEEIEVSDELPVRNQNARPTTQLNEEDLDDLLEEGLFNDPPTSNNEINLTV